VMDPEPIEFAQRSKIGFLAILGASLFVALGAWLVLRPEADRHDRVIGLVNVLFFGACGLVFLRARRRPAVLLRLDSSGIEYRHPQGGCGFHFAWSAIANVRVQNEERASSVVLTLHHQPQIEIPDSAQARGASPSPLSKETTLSPIALGTTAELLSAELDRFRRYYAQTSLSAHTAASPDR